MTSAASRRRRSVPSPRAPYFHNGTAATLDDVVRHYELHFGFVYTDEERADLVAFLNAL
jgi:cytochrome c peroxidase